MMETLEAGTWIYELVSTIYHSTDLIFSYPQYLRGRDHFSLRLVHGKMNITVYACN